MITEAGEDLRPRRRSVRRRAKEVVQEMLSCADIEVGGKRPWDLDVKNEDFYQRVLAHGSLGLGESYMDGWWECSALEEFSNRIQRANLESKIRFNMKTLITLVANRCLNFQSRKRAFHVGKVHYDIGNDLYHQMLDRRMIYSCAYWKESKDLDEAQEAKLELICRKLMLKRGMRVLDIGCGWGGFAIYAAQKHGVEVVGTTISKEQFALARELARDHPVRILLQDYRDLEGRFDRIVSIGMVEHVGYKNYRIFMDKVSQCLEQDGIFLLHTIGSSSTYYTTDPWTEKYIFPNGKIPSLTQLSKAAEGLFVIENTQNIGPDYEPTLLAWSENFERARSLPEAKYDERFRRMWKYYLRMSAGAFRARRLQVFQIVMTPAGMYSRA
jgi:cyclopropane-fatty-acyl-phospholipid synthase